MSGRVIFATIVGFFVLVLAVVGIYAIVGWFTGKAPAPSLDQQPPAAVGQEAPTAPPSPTPQPTNIPTPAPVYVSCGDGTFAVSQDDCDRARQQTLAQEPEQEPPPVQPTPEGRVTNPPSTSSWSCPGSSVANGGCLVTTTTDLVAGLCVDFDPGASSVAGPNDPVKEVTGWKRVKMTGQGAWTPKHQQATATIYQDPSCPSF